MRGWLICVLGCSTAAAYTVGGWSSACVARGSCIMGRKPGVSEPAALAAHVEKAGDAIVIVDARNPDFSLEPGDEATNAKAPIGSAERKRCVNAPFDRKANSLDLSVIPSEWIKDKNVPIITHCGGGGRGQKAKEYLESQGFENVLNGGGPEDPECWAVFGSL